MVKTKLSPMNKRTTESVFSSPADEAERSDFLNAQQLHPALPGGRGRGRGRPRVRVPGHFRARAAHARDHLGTSRVGVQRGESRSTTHLSAGFNTNDMWQGNNKVVYV